MAITNRDLPAGSRLVANYKKQAYVCEVVKDGEGNLVFKVDGKEFKSPSAAASHVMGGLAANGWRFWSRQGEATTANVAGDSAETPAKAERKAKAPRKTRKFKLISRMDEQPTDLEDGQVSETTTNAAPEGPSALAAAKAGSSSWRSTSTRMKTAMRSSALPAASGTRSN